MHQLVAMWCLRQVFTKSGFSVWRQWCSPHMLALSLPLSCSSMNDVSIMPVHIPYLLQVAAGTLCLRASATLQRPVRRVTAWHLIRPARHSALQGTPKALQERCACAAIPIKPGPSWGAPVKLVGDTDVERRAPGSLREGGLACDILSAGLTPQQHLT